MNWKSTISIIIALVGSILSRKGILLPAGLETWILSIFTFLTGLFAKDANGLSLGFKDARTTITSIVTAAAALLAGLGLDVSFEIQTSIVGLGMFIIGLFTKAPGVPTLKP